MTVKKTKGCCPTKNQATKTEVKNITLEQLLTAYFGKDKVKIVQWKWTDEQLKQLEQQEQEQKNTKKKKP